VGRLLRDVERLLRDVERLLRDVERLLRDVGRFLRDFEAIISSTCSIHHHDDRSAVRDPLESKLAKSETKNS
jgi:16S rRNA C967 or C1407 C5-methylase (RsmB/RsmF family)